MISITIENRGVLTVRRLSALALLASNVIKTWNLYEPTNFERANSDQVRVETVGIIHGLFPNL